MRLQVVTRLKDNIKVSSEKQLEDFHDFGEFFVRSLFFLTFVIYRYTNPMRNAARHMLFVLNDKSVKVSLEKKPAANRFLNN